MPLRAGDAFGSIQERVEELGDRLQAAGFYGELVAKKGTELSARPSFYYDNPNEILHYYIHVKMRKSLLAFSGIASAIAR